MHRIASATAILLVGLARAGEDPSWSHVRERLLAHPRLQAAREGFAKTATLSRSAGAMPLPVVEVEVEDFGGSGNAAGFSRAATGVWLGWERRLGDVRGAERALAEAEEGVAGADTLRERTELLRMGRATWEEWLQERWRADMTDSVVSELRTARAALSAARAAGRVEPWEDALARSAFASGEAEAARSRARAAALWAELAALGALPGEPKNVDAPQELRNLEMRQGPICDSLLLESEARRAEAEASLEAALARPSLSGALGVLATQEQGTVGFGVRLAAPLPPWNRVSFDQARARVRSGAARRLAVAAAAERSRERMSLAARIEVARRDWERWSTEVVTARAEAVRSVEAARRQGGVAPEIAWRVREEYWQARRDALERLGTLRTLQLEAIHLEGVEP